MPRIRNKAGAIHTVPAADLAGLLNRYPEIEVLDVAVPEPTEAKAPGRMTNVLLRAELIDAQGYDEATVYEMGRKALIRAVKEVRGG